MLVKDELVTLLGIDLRNSSSNQLFKTFFNEETSETISSDTYFTNKKEGIGVVFEDQKQLENIHLYINKEGYNAFSGTLPMGIKHNDKLDKIVSRIGNIKHESGGGETLPILGKTNRWLKYYFENCFLHFEVNDDNELILMTLGLVR